LKPEEDDFLSVLLEAEAEHDEFDEWDVITLILALIGAGADTTLIAQQWSAYAFLKNKSQVGLALSSPESFSNAFSEIMRWAQHSKMGFARYAPREMEVLGNKVNKGQMILMMPHLCNSDSKYYQFPEIFDVTRKFNNDVLFGYGPRYCIGASLAKHQLYLSMSELFNRFPNASLAYEPARDLTDHNAIVFKNLMIKTNI
jgi:hypothetical protein